MSTYSVFENVTCRYLKGDNFPLTRRIVTEVYLFGTGVHVDKRIAASANFVSSKTPARQQRKSHVAVAGPIFVIPF